MTVSFASLDHAEVKLVARTMSAAQRLHLCGIARAVTRLGNGWIYPLVSLVLLLFCDDERALRILGSSAASLALAFTVYPAMKRALARTRPCDYAPFLGIEAEPLDRYSCPSGHAMTAAGYAVPLIAAWPSAAPIAIALWAAIGWSRIALGHHYLSDVVAGSFLGAAIATPIAVLAL